MSHRDVIRAWKNSAYRNQLSPAEQKAAPGNPAGTIEISDEILGHSPRGFLIVHPDTSTISLCATCISCTIFAV
jgi:mersacidin/lichenicidin family type 2 lantibiotic